MLCAIWQKFIKKEAFFMPCCSRPAKKKVFLCFCYPFGGKNARKLFNQKPRKCEVMINLTHTGKSLYCSTCWVDRHREMTLKFLGPLHFTVQKLGRSHRIKANWLRNEVASFAEYKWLGRGTCLNRQVSMAIIKRCLNECCCEKKMAVKVFTMYVICAWVSEKCPEQGSWYYKRKDW